MTATTPVRVFAKRPSARHWKLLGVFATREAAWGAVVAVPRGFEVWVHDQPDTLKPTASHARPSTLATRG